MFIKVVGQCQQIQQQLKVRQTLLLTLAKYQLASLSSVRAIRLISTGLSLLKNMLMTSVSHSSTCMTHISLERSVCLLSSDSSMATASINASCNNSKLSLYLLRSILRILSQLIISNLLPRLAMRSSLILLKFCSHSRCSCTSLSISSQVSCSLTILAWSSSYCLPCLMLWVSMPTEQDPRILMELIRRNSSRSSLKDSGKYSRKDWKFVKSQVQTKNLNASYQRWRFRESVCRPLGGGREEGGSCDWGWGCWEQVEVGVFGCGGWGFCSGGGWVTQVELPFVTVIVGIWLVGLVDGVETAQLPVVSTLTPLTALELVVETISSGTLSCFTPNISNSSPQLTLSSSLYAKVFFKNSEALKLNGSFLIIVEMGIPLTFLISQFSSRAFQGGDPNSISQKMIPIDHISHLVVQGVLSRSCGAIYMGLPTHDLSICDPKLSTYFANPKSAILKTPSCMSILAGLRSLCTILSCTSCANPQIICLITSNASSSLNLFLLIIYFKSPFLQNSVIMYRLFLELSTSLNFTMLGWLKRLRRQISEKMAFYRYLSLLKVARSTFFIATFYLVSRYMPQQTFPQTPQPRQ